MNQPCRKTTANKHNNSKPFAPRQTQRSGKTVEAVADGIEPDDGTSPVAVPPLDYESHYWVADNDGTASRRQMSMSSGEYRSAITPSIANWTAQIPVDLAADAEDAATQLAVFDSYALSTLGTGSPTLGPMSSVLLRTESTSSSQIENLTVGARQLALAEIGQSSSQNANLVVANVHAMEAALELAQKLDGDAIRAMHRALLEKQPGWEDHAGHYRDSLVWIGTSGISPVGASHVAPQAELIPDAIDDLTAFMRREDVPIVMQAAVAHAQFETIHPFSDGNGRTGRALVHALLKNKGLVKATTAPVSAGLLRDTEGYFSALADYQGGNTRPIIERFCEASRYAAFTGTRLVDTLASEVDRSQQAVSGLRKGAAAHRAIPTLLSQPVTNTATLAQRLGVDHTTSNRALADLAEAGVVSERTGMRRNRVFQHDGVLAALDQYAQAIFRR